MLLPAYVLLSSADSLQGPKQTGVAHFWQMVWDETDEVAVVVMLTQLNEGCREKCFQYYPEDQTDDSWELDLTDEDGKEVKAKLSVEDAAAHEMSKSTIRKLQLSVGEKTKTVYHLLFLGWPDYGVPEDIDRSSLLELIKLSRDKNGGWNNPRIVHCSAGVGRSGTFIALEHLLAELDSGHLDEIEESFDPVFDTVNKLREQRMMMVQSDQQFQFLYETLVQAYHARYKGNEIFAKVEEKMGSGSETATSTTPTGEPAHKAIRLTRHFKTVISSIRNRSTSRERGGRGADRIKAPEMESQQTGKSGNSTPLRTEFSMSQTMEDSNTPDAGMSQTTEDADSPGPVMSQTMEDANSVDSGDTSDEDLDAVTDNKVHEAVAEDT